MSTHIATETKRRYGSLIALSRARSRNRPLQLGRMSAELGSQRFDLPAGEVERAGAVDFLRCMPKFLLEGKLRGDAAKSVFAAHAPLFEALELLLGTAPDNHEAVELLVISGFDQESGFNENRIADAFALPFVHFTMKGLFDAGMNDDVQASQLGGIRKHLGAKLAAVDAAPCAEDSRTKFAEDFVIRGLARLNEVMRQAVRVDQAEAQFAKYGGDSTLAARDAPGKAYAEHAQLMGGCGGLRGERFAASAAKTRGLHRIAHQHGDRHRTNAAGNRCEGAGDLDGVGMDVADEDGSFGAEFFEASREIAEEVPGFPRVGHFVSADIYDRGARTNPIRRDKAGLAHGGDNDVGAAQNVRKGARFGMADGDGGVGVHEEKSHGFPDDVAAAEDDGVSAFDCDPVAPKDFHAAGWRASDEARPSADQAPQIDGMESVHVLCGIDRFEYPLGVHLRGQRKLDQDAVYGVVAIEVLDNAQHIERGSLRGGSDESAGHAELLAGGDFALNVKVRGGIIPRENGSKARLDPNGIQDGDLVLKLGKDFVADFVAVEEARGHFGIIAQRKCRHSGAERRARRLAPKQRQWPFRGRRCIIAARTGLPPILVHGVGCALV